HTQGHSVGAVYEGRATPVPSPEVGSGEKPCPHRVMLGSDRKPLACSPEEKGRTRRAINSAFENQHVDYKSLHISKKDISMKYINSITERVCTYDFGKKSFRKNLWKDRRRRRHVVFSLCGWRQWTGLWKDVC